MADSTVPTTTIPDDVKAKIAASRMKLAGMREQANKNFNSRIAPLFPELQAALVPPVIDNAHEPSPPSGRETLNKVLAALRDEKLPKFAFSSEPKIDYSGPVAPIIAEKLASETQRS